MLNTIKERLPAFLRKKEAPGAAAEPVLESFGHCRTCCTDVRFVAMEPYLRDSFLCTNCGSIPRERALMTVIETYFPNWRELTIHESSPSSRGASKRLRKECAHYLPSQYFFDKTPGSDVPVWELANEERPWWEKPKYKPWNVRCENLEAMTFDDSSIDLHITQDVMEHLFHPEQAFREIARTLKPGGAHIFTAPLWKKLSPASVRARLEASGSVTHLDTPVYHGNPLSDEGSLVTVDWGYDICRHIFDACGLFTNLVYIDDVGNGIRADLNEVLVTLKPYAG